MTNQTIVIEWADEIDAMTWGEFGNLFQRNKHDKYGKEGWRLPSRHELQSAFDQRIQGFSPDFFWAQGYAIGEAGFVIRFDMSTGDFEEYHPGWTSGTLRAKVRFCRNIRNP